jgi:CxxC motif-containing protein (DUF1111 family)
MRIVTLVVCLSAAALAQRPGGGGPPGGAAATGGVDPGVRGGPPSAGQPLPGLTSAELTVFQRGRVAFDEADGVDEGLGPRFNLDSCGGCHSFPASGGTAPRINPQITAATRMGALNRIPPFLTDDGPVRVLRLRRRPDGTPDGGVTNLFVITGRADAPPGCDITQPDFTTPANQTYRIPTPAFGLGLIEAIPDATLRASFAATAARRQALGIAGRFNTNDNDGTITRFGWKAQNKSLQIFSGEAYNVEVGVTNEIFPQEREERCATTASPEDRADHGAGTFSDVELFTQFMRLLDSPRPGPGGAAVDRGRALFDSVGCASCHTASLRTGKSPVAALNEKEVRLYSDLALHRMGARLDDGIVQGAARGEDWRTAPLWGLGQRIFFLHDGRTRDLADAIRQHDSPGSEARLVIQNFNALTAEQRQDLLVFLRSL